MNETAINILLIEDNESDASLIKAMFKGVHEQKYTIEWVTTFEKGLKRMVQGGIHLILLDLGLPDSNGTETFKKLHREYSEMPIIIVCGYENVDLAIDAVRSGAHDYLVKGQFVGNLIIRSINYALERHKIQCEMHALSLRDELTGLFNRRGFMYAAKQQLALAKRLKRNLYLLFIDMDGLKLINDTLGHDTGDRSLLDVADILKETFRASDVLARLAGDEFVVLAIEVSPTTAEALTERLQKNIKIFNECDHRQYKVSLSIGVAYYSYEHPRAIEELLAQADKLMYENKKGKKRDTAVNF